MNPLKPRLTGEISRGLFISKSCLVAYTEKGDCRAALAMTKYFSCHREQSAAIFSRICLGETVKPQRTRRAHNVRLHNGILGASRRLCVLRGKTVINSLSTRKAGHLAGFLYDILITHKPYYTTPCAFIASATLMKPAILAPTTRLSLWPYFSAASLEFL